MQHYSLSAEINGLQVRVLPGSPLSCKDLADISNSPQSSLCGDFYGDSIKNAALSQAAAVQALAKINIRGQWIKRTEHLDLNELFERISKHKLEVYARDGKLPESG
jgi:hypothetical protein